MHRYITWSGAAGVTAPITAVATGTATKAILQLATPSTRQLQILSWGYSLSGAGTSGTGVIELVGVDVAASGGTAHVAAGIVQLDPNAPNSLLTLGTAATGYNFSTLNTPTVSRLFDQQELANTASTGTLTAEQNYDRDFMPDERAILAVSRFLQVRVTFTATTNITAWICHDE